MSNLPSSNWTSHHSCQNFLPPANFSDLSSLGKHSSQWNRFFHTRHAEQSNSSTVASNDNPNRRTSKMARLEAVLFVTESALSARRLAQLATIADAKEVRNLIEQLNKTYDNANCAFRIERVATGYQMLTRPAFVFWLDKLHQRQSRMKLSPPAMETLSIVAYRQQITRADIEAIRGVQCTEMLKQLMERSLVRITGEDDSLGRPYLYGTTTKFLEMFGLKNLDDLPMADTLRFSNASKSNPSEETPDPDDERNELDEEDDDKFDEELEDDELDDDYDSELSEEEEDEYDEDDFDDDDEDDEDFESAA